MGPQHYKKTEIKIKQCTQYPQYSNLFFIIMKNIFESAAEAEVGDILHHGQEAEPIRITLHEIVNT